MGSIDIQDILSQYGNKQDVMSEGKKTVTMAEKLGSQKINDNSEMGVRKTIDETMHIKDEERRAMAEQIENQSYTHTGRRLSMGEFQKYLADSFTNTLNVKNAQKVVMMGNQENMRKGLAPEINAALSKNAGKGQMSTVTIPTQLLRRVQQEIGGLGVKATQNDVMTGFLYWYFGRPEDVSFGSNDSIAKISEIVSNLDENASPSKFGQLSYNASNTILETLSSISDKMDTILSMVAGITKDSLDSKVKSDKIYIALCYNILNMLAFTPPMMPGDQPKDVDVLAGGLAWDLMSGIDDAYDYYKAKNGREIYKSKMRKRVNAFTYAPPTYEQPQYSAQSTAFNDGYENSGNQDIDPNDRYTGDDDDNYELIDLDNDYDNIQFSSKTSKSDIEKLLAVGIGPTNNNQGNEQN